MKPTPKELLISWTLVPPLAVVCAVVFCLGFVAIAIFDLFNKPERPEKPMEGIGTP